MTWTAADVAPRRPRAASCAAPTRVVHLAWLIQPCARRAHDASATNVEGSAPRLRARPAAPACRALVYASSVGAYARGPEGPRASTSRGRRRGSRRRSTRATRRPSSAILDRFEAEHPRGPRRAAAPRARSSSARRPPGSGGCSPARSCPRRSCAAGLIPVVPATRGCASRPCTPTTSPTPTAARCSTTTRAAPSTSRPSRSSTADVSPALLGARAVRVPARVAARLAAADLAGAAAADAGRAGSTWRSGRAGHGHRRARARSSAGARASRAAEALLRAASTGMRDGAGLADAAARPADRRPAARARGPRRAWAAQPLIAHRGSAGTSRLRLSETMAQEHLDRLTAIDASFLHQEGPTSHMHVGARHDLRGPAAAVRRVPRHAARAPAPRAALPPEARGAAARAPAGRCGSTTRASTSSTTCATPRCRSPGSEEQLLLLAGADLLPAARPLQAAVGAVDRRGPRGRRLRADLQDPPRADRRHRGRRPRAGACSTSARCPAEVPHPDEAVAARARADAASSCSPRARSALLRTGVRTAAARGVAGSRGPARGAARGARGGRGPRRGRRGPG